jgi:nucleotide-binding universal stress UspA family protein
MDINNILVPTDFSDNSVQAFDFGLSLASQNSAELHLLHVVVPDMLDSFKLNLENIDDNLHSKIMEAEEELRRFIAKIPPCEVKIIESLRVGDPVEQIIDYSKNKNIDMITIASHGWSNYSHLPTGNITNKILSYSEIQVVCIKTGKVQHKVTRPRIRSSWAENWVG